MVTKSSVEQGTLSLNDIIFLMSQNYSRAASRGLVLSWKYKHGVYYSYVKKNDVVVYTQFYTESLLIKAIIYMQIDFNEFLNLKAIY